MTIKSQTLYDILSAQGPFAETISDYVPRQQQIDMAECVEQTLEQQQIAIIEAGTGTGKTFAYLIPAFLSDKKVIIATGTKNLQDQLFWRDLPLVQKTLGIAKKTALLKGRQNYICQYRLQYQSSEGLFEKKSTLNDIANIQSQLAQSKTGDIADFIQVSPDSDVWPLVTSTADNCLGQDCPFYDDCYLVKARRKAIDADILVINHHLFFADLKLKQEGFGEILPGAEAIIFDEAHQLPEVATHFFGEKISSRQIMELSNDISLECVQLANDMPELSQLLANLQFAVGEMRDALGEKLGRRPWYESRKLSGLDSIIDKVNDYLQQLCQYLDSVKIRSKGMEKCFDRAMLLEKSFSSLTRHDQSDCIHWWENFRKSFTIHATPMSVADEFSNYLAKQTRAWIFTSATLAVNQDFSHFQQEMGVNNATCLCLDSPFDYRQQAMLYLPRGMSDPQAMSYTTEVVEMSLPIIDHLQGKTLMLFTSFQALRQAAEMLKSATKIPILVQGQAPNQQLLSTFRDSERAVLLGTMSFWEGIDVKGDALSCVIIDKLPFASPGDPILSAKINLLKQQGDDPFYRLQLPKAVLTLKQGVGRLIRSSQDSGVLVICDPRLMARDYGVIFLKSLPPMQRSRCQQQVLQFLPELENIDHVL